MKNALFLFLSFCVCAMSALRAAAGDTPPFPLTVTVSSPTDAHICGTSEIVVTFTNNSSESIVINPFGVHLDYPDYGTAVTLGGISNSPQFSIVSGLNTPDPVISCNATLGVGQQFTLTLLAQYSCDLWDDPGQCVGMRTRVQGNYSFLLSPNTYLFKVDSEPYDIGHTLIHPGSNLPVAQANWEAPFSFTVPLEIDGNYCDPDFTVIVEDIPACVDFSDATYTLIYGTTEATYSGTFGAHGNALRFDVNVAALLIPELCEDNYPGYMGELKIRFDNVVLDCDQCEQGTFYQMLIGVTPCNEASAPDDCKVNGQLPPQESVIQELYVPTIPSATLTLEETGNESFSICDNLVPFELLLSNTSGHAAYDIDLGFLNNMGYVVFQIRINGINYGPYPQGNNVSVNLSNNTNAAYGFQDLNGDQIYEELAPNASVPIVVYFRTGDPNHCGIGSSDACTGDGCAVTTFTNPLVAASVGWNNRCSSSARTSSLDYTVDLPSVTMNVKSDIEKLSLSPIKLPDITVELAGGPLTGFEDYLDQGDITRFVCIHTDDAPVNYTSATLNGQPVTITSAGYIDLGSVSAEDIANGIVVIEFQVLSCEQNVVEIRFDITFGFYFDNCPDCKITLACGNARFLSPCSGGGNCDSFTSLSMDFYNGIYAPLTGPVPNPAKVYPCDDIITQVVAELAADIVDNQLRVGFKVADDMLGLFVLPAAFNGLITALRPAPFNDAVALTFGASQVVPVPLEAFSIVYFQGANSIDLPAGTILDGEFTLRMGSDFPSGFVKVDYFSGILGVQTDPEEFCFSPGAQLYALEPGYRIEEQVSADCAEGGLFTGQLIKTGGELYGPDFPDFPRVVATIIGNIEFTIDGGNDDYHVLSNDNNCTQLPDNPHLIPSGTLQQPSGLEISGKILQEFQIRYEQNGAGNVPVDISYSVRYRPGANAPCSTLDPHSDSFGSSGAVFPKIVSHPAPWLGPVEYGINNTTNLVVHTANLGGAATKAWVQVEYDPLLVSIDPALVTGPLAGPATVLDGACGKKILLIPINDLAVPGGSELVHTIPLTLLEGSCATSPVLDIYGMHRCGCTPFDGYACAADYADPQVREDSRSTFQLIPVDAGLTLSGLVCHTPTAPCDVFEFAVLLDNYEGGNLNDLTAGLNLPAGIELLHASYTIGVSGGDICIPGDNLIDTELITNDGWHFPEGILYGHESGLLNNDRRIRLFFRVRACGVDLDQHDFSIRVWGIKPCGQEVERSQTYHNVFSGTLTPRPFVHISPASIVYYACNTNTGLIQLTASSFTQPWPGNARIEITVTCSDPNVVISNPVLITSYPNSILPITFINNGTSCNFSFDISTRICLDFDCAPGEQCTVCYSADFVTLNIARDISGTAAISWCNMNDPQVVVTINVPGATSNVNNFTNARIYCDLNSNGVVDAGEPVLFSQPTGSFQPVAGQPGFFTVAFPVTQALLNSCASGQIIVTFGSVGSVEICYCLDPIIANVACSGGFMVVQTNCQIGSNTLTPVHAFVNLVAPFLPFQFNYTGARLYCDANSNGIVDPNEAQLFFQQTGTFMSVPGQPGLFRTTLQVPSNALFSCSSFQVILTFATAGVENTCFCIRPIVGTYCTELYQAADNRTHTPNETAVGQGNSRPGAASDGFVAAVSPNPSRGIFLLTAASGRSETCQVVVLDRLGRELLRSQIELERNLDVQQSLDLSLFPDGMYFLSVRSEQHVWQQVLVKQ